MCAGAVGVVDLLAGGLVEHGCGGGEGEQGGAQHRGVLHRAAAAEPDPTEAVVEDRQVPVGVGGALLPGLLAFQTPLGTKHAFQGWADQFLTTAADGIQDRYIGATTPLWGGQLQAWYHEFIADRGGVDFGRESDLSYQHRLPWSPRLTALAKLARYRSDDATRTVDTYKAWLQLQYTY